MGTQKAKFDMNMETKKSIVAVSCCSGFKRLSRFSRLGIVEASFTLRSLLKTLQIRKDGDKKLFFE